MRTRTLTITALALATTLALAGCAPSNDMDDTKGMDHGSSSTATDDTVSAAAQADIDFAMNMIAHHQQAIEMSDMLLAKSGVDAEVAQLAERIKAAQQPEIDTMREWLTAWGQDPDLGGMDHGDGMMSADDMTALEEADGPDASRLFLEQMIVHHEGAIEMAEAEIAAGKDADALALAQRVIDDQTAEIAEMQSMIDAL